MVAKGLQPLAWADIDNKLAAPWTVEQVAFLNGYQRRGSIIKKGILPLLPNPQKMGR